MKSFCSLGSKYVWPTIQFSRYLPKKYQKIIDQVIQRNAYFGAPENILLSMLVDDRMCIRELANKQFLIQDLAKQQEFVSLNYLYSISMILIILN